MNKGGVNWSSLTVVTTPWIKLSRGNLSTRLDDPTLSTSMESRSLQSFCQTPPNRIQPWLPSIRNGEAADAAGEAVYAREEPWDGTAYLQSLGSLPIAETDVLPLMEVQQDQLIYQSVSSTLSTTETVGLLRPSGESVKSTYLAGHEYY